MKTNPLMRNLFWLCILLIIAGCTDMSIEDISVKSDEEFYASFENTDSRTYVDDQIRLRWTAEDCIALFRKTTYNREYMFTGVTGANAGGFKQKSIDDDFWYGADVPYNYAVYPYSVSTQLDETDYYFTLTMPDEQTYVENSFGLGANTMVAVSETGQLTFKNVGSYLRVRLYGEDVSVSSITLTSKGDESISGTAKVTPVLNGYPTCEMIGTGKSIRLICPKPAAISNDANNPTDFWIVVPPVTLTNGFSVTVENSEGNTQVFEVPKTFTFERNMYTDMKREVSISSEDAIPYLTFTADAEQTFTMSQPVLTLEYSVNGSEWLELGVNTVTFGGTYGDLRLRGKSRIGTRGNGQHSRVIFGRNTFVSCRGDIRTLVDFENYSTADTSGAYFSSLFKDCVNLTTSPDLPTTALASDCYLSMFEGCTNLKIAPELPATILASQCYSFMFKGCTNLKVAPKLPATTLTFNCYMGMFYNCENLTTAPELPATILASGCYESMFSGCIKLITAPALPATSLAWACYSDMFSRCINLKAAPELPVTTLMPYCYSSMFQGCTNLTTAPALPATTVALSCYSNMFYDCENLITAPELPAKTLVESCYSMMFVNCKKLSNITMLATDVSAESCLREWVWGVASTGVFTKAKEMKSLTFGLQGIPTGWTIVNK